MVLSSLRALTIWLPTCAIVTLGHEVGHTAAINEAAVGDAHPLVGHECFGVHDVFVYLITFQVEWAVDQVTEYRG